MADFFINVLKLTTLELFGIFGIFFILGYLLSKTQEWTQEKYARTVGWRGILWTAWIGTPFHELGHYLFAKIFLHKINHFRIFEPNEKTGELGRVDHSFNRFSLYQRVGNFFIGGAPMIFGSAILFLLAYLFVPNGKELLSALSEARGTFAQLSLAAKNALITLFTYENISRWDFWLFIYLSFSIASHLAPSRADRRGMWSGLVYIILTLIFINIITLLFKVDTPIYIVQIKQSLSLLTGIFLYALSISIIHFVLAYVFLGGVRIWKR